jgi:hypothetical protein
MSDGGIGGSLSFWATINIRGNLTKEQLKTVTKELRNILGSRVTQGNNPEIDPDEGVPIEGQIVQRARVADPAAPSISVNIADVRNTLNAVQDKDKKR